MRQGYGYSITLLATLLSAGACTALHARAPQAASTADLKARRVFHEPLVPVRGEPSESENLALNRALETYLAKGDPSATGPIHHFMKAHPASSWNPALLSGLAAEYYREGRLTQAVTCWREAWKLSKSATGLEGQRVAEESAARLADLLGRLGRRKALASLLQEFGGRARTGTAGSLLQTAQQQLKAMEEDPTHTYLCGPRALGDLAGALGASSRKVDLLVAGAKGTNMAQLQTWGENLGLKLEGIRLAPKADVPVPSILAWKAGHFATVLKEDNGRFLVKNYLAGEDRWVAADVLREESSGIALVPGDVAAGRERVSPRLLGQVWGTGGTSGPQNDPNKDDPKLPDDDCKGPKGLARHSIYATQTSYLVEDIPLWYAPPVGSPVDFHVYYNQWETQQPQTFTYWNFGPKWTMDWLSYITDDPANPGVGTTLYMRGGGVAKYSGYSSATGAFSNQFYQHDLLVRTSPTSYERRLPDGSKEIFSAPNGAISPRKIFLTQIVDASGNALTFTYDAQMRLVRATDALGQVTTLTYDLASDPLKVTRVSDPFGRTAKFEYNASNQLLRITDMGGLTSEFAYGPTAAAPSVGADFLNALITPYGTTTFAAGLNGTTDRWLQVTDPLGQVKRAEYRNYTSGMAVSDPAVPTGCWNSYFYYRNTFYWDKRAMAAGGGIDLARIYHFMHGPNGMTSTLLESSKAPLENRVFYGYEASGGSSYVEGSNSSAPTSVARLLDDGSQQWTRTTYNTWGKPVKVTDPGGRVTSYVYSADGLDLLEVRNTTGTTNDLLAKYTYNTQRKPLTVTDAAGKTTTFTYNAAGQIQTITNPKNETTTFTYISGYLTSITGATPGATTTFTYDSVGRTRSVTGPDGNTIMTDYDQLDRPVTITYGDGTTEEMIYNKLDMVAKKDRHGRWTTMSYDPLQQLSTVRDAAGRTTSLSWCNCGSLEQLVDPAGQITNWWRDYQGRVIGKRLNDGTQTSYSYDSAGRLIQRVDAKGQATNYQYWPDNNLKRVDYVNAQKATPSVSYTYDGVYNRLSTMTDGYGTTTYSYHPVGSNPVAGAGRLATVTGPFPNSTISYAYDELGRVVNRGINGVAESREFDALGRLSKATNPLGLFQYAYQGDTGRLEQILYPNGQKTVFSYLGATQDHRLAGISNQKGDASVISAFTYTYDADGAIETWSQQAEAQIPKVYSFTYDAANQLIGAVLNEGGPSGALIRQYLYGYDLAGNRTSEQIDQLTTTSEYNSTNQLTTQRKSPAP